MDKHTIDLRHQGCGGWFSNFATSRGTVHFRCEKCEADVRVPWGDNESAERERLAREEREARWAAMPPVPPRVPRRGLSRQESLVLGAYGQWSEYSYCAGFISPDPETVRQFIDAMDCGQLFADYEEEMLKAYEELTGVDGGST